MSLGMDVTASRWAAEDAAEPSMAAGWHHEVIVGPSPLFGSNGMRVSPGGDLWITQSMGDRITSWEPASGRFRIVAGTRDGMSGPDDLAFDSAGNAYVSQPRDGWVSVMDRAGMISVLVDDAPEANGITVTPDNRLFVDECRSGGRLLEVATDGSFPARVVRSGLGMANALEMGPDGWLYLPEIETGRILAVDPASGKTTVAREGVAVPSCVKFDGTGRLVVGEAATGELVATDLSTGDRQVLASSDPGLDNFAFDGRGLVYVSNFVNGSVLVADLVSGAQRMITPPGLLGPCSLSSRGGKRLLVGDWMSVVEADEGGTLRRVALVPIDFTVSVVGAIEIDGDLLVLASDGQVYARPTGGGSFEPVRLGEPAATALCGGGSDGYVATGARVLHLGAGAGVVDAFDSGLASITAIASHDGGGVAVCERASGRVKVTGAAVHQSWSGFDDPCAVAISQHAVYVAEGTARRVLRVDRANGQRTVIATSSRSARPRRDTASGSPRRHCSPRATTT